MPDKSGKREEEMDQIKETADFPSNYPRHNICFVKFSLRRNNGSRITNGDVVGFLSETKKLVLETRSWKTSFSGSV